MTKTNYDQSENFKRIEKKIEKSSVNPIAAFDHKYRLLFFFFYEINYNTIQKQKNLKVHPLNFEKVLN